jgi:hypothetical protein
LEVRESRRTSADELEVGTLRREIKWRGGGEAQLDGAVSGKSLSIPDESSLSGECRSMCETDGKVLLMTVLMEVGVWKFNIGKYRQKIWQDFGKSIRKLGFFGQTLKFKCKHIPKMSGNFRLLVASKNPKINLPHRSHLVSEDSLLWIQI